MTNTLKSTLMGAACLGLFCAAIPAQAQEMSHMNHNSIQPETTLSISADAEVNAVPDMATISGGVISEAPTAEEALRQNSKDMEGVYNALKEAGIPEKDIQTSNFSLQPRYDYPEDGQRVLRGYTATNQVTAKITDMDNVGTVIDAMVSQGGNSFNGVNFSVEDPSDLLNEARRMAMKKAMERAELYAEVSGYSVARIVTINESTSYNPGPQPMMMVRAESDQGGRTKVSGGELTFTANVNVLFELEK